MNGNSVRAEIDEEVRRIASALASRVDELAQCVASAVRAEVDFYKSTGVVTNDELLTSSTDNLQFALKCLEAVADFDTSPADATGSKRAAAGVPLPAVMDAYRIASHRLWDAVVRTATNLARAAMFFMSLGTSDKNSPAPTGEQHQILVPDSITAQTPYGELVRLAPPVKFSETKPYWEDPVLVVRGSSKAQWKDS